MMDSSAVSHIHWLISLDVIVGEHLIMDHKRNGVFTRCDRRGDRSRDRSSLSIARAIAATIACLFTRCDRRGDRRGDRSVYYSRHFMCDQNVSSSLILSVCYVCDP